MRFAREAHVLASLNHPHIAAIYGVEQDGARAALVLELVDGDTLAARIVHGALPLEEALGLARQIAEALEAAHEQGVVHRDLKPANIMVTRGGAVKVLDFGLAKMVDATTPDDEVASSPTRTSPAGVTRIGTVLGTPAYMSPEQAQGRDADKRSDVWAFGCVLFEMLTGRPAFGHGAPAEVLARVRESEPDWTALPASTPSAVRLVMERCLRKDANRRLRHIDPFQLEISGDHPAAVKWRVQPWAAAALGLALAATGALTWTSVRSTPTTPAAQPVVRLTMPFTVAGHPGEWNQRRLAVAPDGSSVVYGAAANDGQMQLYLRRTDREVASPLAGTEGGANPFFSPDGAWVGFFAAGRLKKVSIDTGLVQTVADVEMSYGAVPYGGDWGPNDLIVFGGPHRSGLMAVSAFGGTPAAVLTEIGPGEAVHRWPSLSPTGRVVVYTTSNSSGPGLEEPRIVAESLDSGSREILPVEAGAAWFGPSGNRLLLARDGTLMSVGFDTARLTTSGEPVRLMEGMMQASTGAAQVASSSTMLAYMRGLPESRRLVWVDREGRIEPLDAPPRLYVHPRLSPDGQRIAVAITAPPKNDIWMYDIPRSTLSRLTFEGSNAYPIWTRDGTRITYVSGRKDHPPNVFWTAADGTGAEERLLTSGNTQVTESWSPDEMLLFVELRPGASGWDILMLGLTGSREPIEFLTSPFCDCTPQVSPSGRYLAYHSNRSGVDQVHVLSFPGQAFSLQVSSEGGSRTGWRGDERELYFRAADAMMVAKVAPEPDGLTIGKPTVLFRGDFARIQGKNYDVTSDGKRFLMVRVDEPVSPGEISVVLNWRKDFDLERRSVMTN